MDADERPHKLLSEEELAALTEGLAAPAPAVLAISPFVNDQQALARALRGRGFRVIAAARATWPENAVAHAAAAIVAGELLREDPGAVERLRAARADLPIYVIWDDLASPPPEVPPPAGIWARSLLAECVAMLGAAGDAPAAAPGAVPEARAAAAEPPASPPPQAAPAGKAYTELLEALLAPACDAPAFLRGSLRSLRAYFRVPAAAVLLHHGGFLLEIDAESAALRREAGRFLMDAGRRALFQAVPARLRPNAFAAADYLPLVRGPTVLGAVFLFWTRDAPVPDSARIAALVGSRLWEFLCRASPGAGFVPFETFLERARSYEGVLLLGAPLGEDAIERLLAPDGFWTREPGGAVLCCLARAPAETPGALGEDFTGFTTRPGRHADLGAWVRAHAEVAAELRQAGRRGVLPA